jgi:hypothetical protein
LKLENTGIINKQFSKYLIKKDVKPISGPSIDGYAKFLFYREDVNIYIEEFKKI